MTDRLPAKVARHKRRMERKAYRRCFWIYGHDYVQVNNYGDRRCKRCGKVESWR